MEHVIAILEQFRFTKTEALVYVDLLKNGHLTGYQIAKNIGLSRSSVYNALNALYRKGYIFLLPGENNLFRALETDILIPRLKREFEEAAKSLDEALSHLETSDPGGRYLNVEGQDNLIVKAKELLLEAEADVLINTDFNLSIFEQELLTLVKRGIRIMVFTFSKVELTLPGIEIFSHAHAVNGEYASSRLMITVDSKRTLIGSKEQGKYVGTYTDNTLLSKIVAEHIHHDIYLLNIKNKYGDQAVSDEIKVKSNFEEECTSV